MGDRLHQGGLSSRAIRWAALATVVVAAAVTTVLLTRTDEGGGTGELSADFTPESGSVVPSGDVRAQLVEALQRLLAEPFVSVESVGFTEGRRSDVVASVDVVGRRMSSRELISDGVQVGEPRSAHPLISELVVLGNDGWLRVLQPAESADTPFQFIDATGDVPVLLRPGAVTAEDIARATGVAPVAANAVSGRPTSPGQILSHYAPRAAVRLNATTVAADEALLAFGSSPPARSGPHSGPTINLSPAGDLKEAASRLFAALRELDTTGVRAVAVMLIPETGLGAAINDRLRRAAAPR